MTDPLAVFWVHTVTVEPVQPQGPEGETFTAAYPLVCFVSAKTRLVRTSASDMVVSETTITAPAATASIPVGSRITLPDGSPDGSRTTVLRFARADGGGLPTPDHVEIVCE